MKAKRLIDCIYEEINSFNAPQLKDDRFNPGLSGMMIPRIRELTGADIHAAGNTGMTVSENICTIPAASQGRMKTFRRIGGQGRMTQECDGMF